METQLQKWEKTVNNEWRNLHHNASLAAHLPEFANDYEVDVFGEELYRVMEEKWLPELRQMIEERFGYSLRFTQYGRNGATVAPIEWMVRGMTEQMGMFNGGAALMHCTDDDRKIRELQQIQQCLVAVNSFWRVKVVNVRQWWQKTKAEKGLDAEIRAMQSKRLVMQEAWV